MNPDVEMAGSAGASAVHPTPRVLPWTFAQWLAWSFVPLLCLVTAFALQLNSSPATQGQLRSLFVSLNQLTHGGWPGVWSFLTLMGDTGVLLGLMSPLLLFRPQAVASVVAAVPIGGLFSAWSKWLVDAPRPVSVLDAGQFHLIGPALGSHSFPSGHTISAFAVAAAVLAVGVCAQKPLRSSVAVLAAVGLAALIGFSRVAVGAHWPLDVLAGAGGGWLAGLGGAAIARGYPLVWQSPVNQRWAACLIFGVVAWLVSHPVDYPQGILAVWLSGFFALATLALLVRTWLQNR